MDYEEKELYKKLTKQSWRFAKTMPYMPHYHVWIDRWTSQEDFKYCVNAISKFGIWEFHMIEPRHYFYDSSWRYWWMNGRDGTPTVINRERIEIRSPKQIPRRFL